MRDRITSHGRPTRMPNGNPEGSFTASDGTEFRRWRAVIAIDDKAYKCDSYGVAKRLFARLSLEEG